MGELFKLFVSITTDTSDFDKGVEQTEKKGKKLGEALKTGLGKAVSFVAKAAVAAVTAAAAGISLIAKQAVSSYAEYEQLLGGVQKLYGNMGMTVEEYAESVGKSVDEVKDQWQSLEEAQNLVLRNAQQAYKTAGMSANQYMETATSFSAALINSLGGNTVKAAEQTDVAMRAISDNVNTFGTDIEAVKGAFQGFAKQQYNMLDNLKLGYGGTKSEMERLIKDANEYAKANGMAADLSIDSFSDIITAIDLIQQKQNIAGTTAREAATTIEGSVNTAKAAWQNLLTAFGSGEDVKGAITNFVESAKTVFQNSIPIFKNALEGIALLVKELAPIIEQELPGLINDLLPAVLDAATSLVVSLAKALPGIMQAVWNALGDVLDQLGAWLNEKYPTIGRVFTNIRDKASETFKKIVEVWNTKLKPAFREFSTFLKEKVLPVAKTVFEAIGTAIGWVKDHLDVIMPVLMAVVGFIVGSQIAGIILGIVSAISTAITVIQSLAAAIGMIQSFAGLVSVITTLAGGPITLLIAAIGALVAAFLYLWNTSDEFRNFWIGLWENIKAAAGAVADWLITSWNNLVDTVINLKENIVNTWENLKTSVKEKADEIRTAVSDKFNELKDRVTTAITTAKENVSNKFTEMKTNAVNKVTETYNTVKNKFDDIKKAVTDKINGARDAVSNAIDRIKGFFNFSWSLPHLKLPHVSISGSFSLLPPRTPKFSVEWYDKAMDKAILLRGASIFGMMNGKGLGGGESGNEIVTGEDYLEKKTENALLRVLKKIGGFGDQIVINIYTQPGQSETEIAEMVQRKLTLWERQRQAAYV